MERIVLTAAITAGLALVVLGALRARLKTLALIDCLLVALVVGGSVLVWRSVGNTGALNEDPIPGVSPNDVLCPLVTYLFLGWYAAFRRPSDAVRFEWRGSCSRWSPFLSTWSRSDAKKSAR